MTEIDKPESPELAAARLELNVWQKVSAMMGGSPFSFRLSQTADAEKELADLKVCLSRINSMTQQAEKEFQALLAAERPEALDPKPVSVGPEKIADLGVIPSKAEAH